MANQGIGKVDNTLGNAALYHQTASQDEQRNSDQCGAVGTGKQALDDYGKGITAGNDATQGNQPQGKADRNTNEEENKEQQNINHFFSSSLLKLRNWPIIFLIM